MIQRRLVVRGEAARGSWRFGSSYFNCRVYSARLNIAPVLLFMPYPRRGGSKGKFFNSLIITEQPHVACLILRERSAVTAVPMLVCGYKEHGKDHH